MEKLVVKVYGLPPDRTEESLRDLHQEIVGVIVKMGGFHFLYKTEEDVLVWFVPDHMQYGLGTEFLVEISNVARLQDQFDRKMTLRDLAKHIGTTVQNHFSHLHPDVSATVLEDPHCDNVWWSSRDSKG